MELDEYKLNDAVWHPYWRNELVKAEGENAYASCYESEKGLVSVAAYFDKGDGKIVLEVPETAKIVKDLLTGKEYEVTDARVTVESDMSTLNLLLIK